MKMQNNERNADGHEEENQNEQKYDDDDDDDSVIAREDPLYPQGA